VTDGENSYTVINKGDKLKVYTKIRILDFHKPAVGDVFVFTPPPESNRTQSFIKRIVGVPGDVIMVRDGDLYRNNERVTGEDYVKRVHNPHSLMTYGPETVPPGHVFAMGDNRDLSSDSRAWGFVPIENIKGQAFLKYFSWNPEGNWLHKIRFSRIARRIK
jgi:signal peptidase I